MGYSKEIYQRARKILDGRRELAQRTALEHRDALFADIPDLRRIESELAETGLYAARAAVSGGETAREKVEELRRKNERLQNERASILQSAGLPKDFFSVRYNCPICQDTGYVAQKRCACLNALLKKTAYESVSDTAGMKECSFANFSLEYYPIEQGAHGVSPRKAMEKVCSFCREYAGSFTLESDSLLFLGGTGLGKTHLSLAIAYEAIERGFGVYYTGCQKLMDKLQTQQFQRSQSDDNDYLSMAIQCDLLVLDDFGAEFTTNFTIAALQNIINSRLSESRPSIVSTNLSNTQLRERYGDRLLSRLSCAYQVMPFYGEDIRKIKRFGNIRNIKSPLMQF